MSQRKRVLLKGELHSSEADRREALTLLGEGVDVLVLEGSGSPADFRFLAGWFHVSIGLLSWLLSSLYRSKETLVELAAARDVEVVYTRADDVAPLARAPLGMKAVSAGLFYTLVPASLWVGFATSNHLVGSMALFLGLVLPVLVVRIYNTNRPDGPGNRDRRIARAITEAGGPGDTVLAVVGVGHLPGVRRRLPPEPVVTLRRPVYDAWSLRHARDVGLPAIKAGFVLFSLYVVSLWVVVRVVGWVSPLLVGMLT